jgi:hypothetical protein
MDADKAQYRRVIRGMNTLFNSLKETGQDRLHQFVRSLEALILTDIGRTEKQFEHRCHIFARAGNDIRGLLLECFDMRSDNGAPEPLGTTPRSGTTSGRKPRSRPSGR